MNKYLPTILLGIIFISGCASVQPVQSGNLTPGMANKTIIKGKTTQNEILTVFGAPNIITKNKSGNEVWTYDKMSVESGASEVYGSAIVVGGAGVRSASSTMSFTLMIEFDDNEVVKDFSYRASSF